jgi:glycosyltransferase involved in cell wall biosynthesis
MAREFGYSERQLVAIPNAIPDPGTAGPHRTSLPENLVAASPPGRLRIVQVGSLDDRKGGSRLIEAFSAARCDASLWFVGEGPARESWTSLAGDLGIADRVVFTGRRDDLPRLFSAFDLVVLASEREGMPYVLIEAMAMARPILATGVDGVPELVEPTVNGIAIGPGDDIALARELRTLSADPERLRRMGERGRERFEADHRFEEFVERTWRQYGEEASGWPTSIASS